MLEPIQQRTWSAPDRRAWGLSLSLLLVSLVFALVAFFYGRSWTFRTELEYTPKELTIKAYDIDSDLVEFSLGLPAYPIGTYFSLSQILPENWIYYLEAALFFLGISLLAAGVSYFKDTLLYGCLTAFALGVVLFGIESFAPLGITDQWIVALVLVLVILPVYLISQWRDSWNLARRWWVMLAWYFLLGVSVFQPNIEISQFSQFLPSIWYPLLLAAVAFMVLNASDVLQGVLTLVTKEENSRQSWVHFSIFSILYLANFLLLYLKNTGQMVLDIYYPNPFLVQGFTLIIGFWMLEKKAELTDEEPGKYMGLASVYSALAVLTLSLIGIGFATANDLIIEVLEDAICLIHFCMGAIFFLYVVINYFQLMAMGLRVYLVLFRPRYMPVFSIPVFGLAAVWMFLVNEGYYPYYQALSAKSVMTGDHFLKSGNLFLAENYFKNALSFESRSQRGNLSLAGLYAHTGNTALAQDFARTSMEKVACPEAIMAIAQGYKSKNLPLQELLELQEGLRKFPGNGKLRNNLGMVFNETNIKDSSAYYFSMALESEASASVAKSNLSFYYLVNRLETEGLPQKSPESESSGNWPQINNSLVFANAAREKSPSTDYLIRNFSAIPMGVKPFLLYHMMINKAINRDSSQRAEILKLQDDSLKQHYSESFDMANAIWNYRTGNALAGIDRLLQLEQQSTGNRLALDLLLGQIFFEQGSFEMATSYFRKAAKMGFNRAWYWYAISCLEGGKAEEAADAFRESLSFLGPNDRIRTTVLMDGLRSGQFYNAAQRSDPEKSAYLKVNWAKLTDQQIKDLIYLVSDKEAQRLLWSYSFRRAYNESRPGRCKNLMAFGRQIFGKRDKWKRMLNGFQAQYLEISCDEKGLSNWVKKNEKEDWNVNFYKARLLQMQGNKPEAAEFFEKSIANSPLNTRMVSLAIGFLANQPDKHQVAYDKALQISDLDPSNVEFLKLYAILAVKEGLYDFAYPMVAKIEVLRSKAEAQAFKIKLDEMVKEKYSSSNVIP